MSCKYYFLVLRNPHFKLLTPEILFKFLTEPDNLLKCSAYPEMNFKLFLKFFLKFLANPEILFEFSAYPEILFELSAYP